MLPEGGGCGAEYNREGRGGMRKIIVGAVLLATFALTHWMAYNEGQISVRAHTRVRAFALGNGGYGPYFGECLPNART